MRLSQIRKVHVIPVAEEELHQFNTQCKCKLKMEVGHKTIVITHNQITNRETKWGVFEVD